MDTHHGGGLLDRLRHHLPTQASLKDFIHHNTLHAYQDLPFHQALRTASSLHGSATYLSLSEYRHLQQTGRISQEILQNRVQRYLMERYYGPYPQHEFDKLLDRILYEQPEDADIHARIGRFRAEWIHQREINLNKSVHPLLFRLIAGYLDQGIASWKFPYPELGFIQGLRRIVNEGSITIFRSAQVRRWFRHGIPSLSYLLERVVGDATAFETYLFDQQFEHPGWSGFVATTEAQPEILLDRRHVTLEEWIVLELLLEIDALDHKFPGGWLPLTASAIPEFPDLFADLPDQGEQSAILEIWQDAYEWSYYDQVLGGLKQTQSSDQMGQMRQATDERDTFQAIFCIDDREYSLRRHLQNRLKSCSTYGTPGFFGVAIYFQPEHGKFITKCCPAPVEPRHLVVEHERKRKPTRDISMRHARGSLFRGWLLSNTLGLMAGMRLLGNLFNPRPVAVMADSLQHMDEHAKLEYVYNGRAHQGYQIGFTDQEMTSIVHRTLSTIGLTSHFAAHIYMIGHGGSSVNNPYYAGYDCGACSGRPGSVNARLFAAMANRHEVRHMLREQYGWHIPAQTRFIGALHDTTRDEVVYFDVHSADLKERALHHRFVMGMKQALVDNARERAIRFPSVHRSDSDARLMRAIRKRSFAFFEPRPEWNLDHFVFSVLLSPMKRIKKFMKPIPNSFFLLMTIGIMLLSIFWRGSETVDWAGVDNIVARGATSMALGIWALLLMVKAYNERGSLFYGWTWILLGNLLVFLSTHWRVEISATESALFLSGIILSSSLGYVVLLMLRAQLGQIPDLNAYRGLIHTKPTIGFFFLMCGLGMSGFPITTTFLGQDLLLSHIKEGDFVMAALIASSFVLNGISIIRMYARVFLGHHQKSYLHSTPQTI